MGAPDVSVFQSSAEGGGVATTAELRGCCGFADRVVARVAVARAASRGVREDPCSVVLFLHKARIGRDGRALSIAISLKRTAAIACSPTQWGRIADTWVAKTVDIMAVADSSSANGV